MENDAPDISNVLDVAGIGGGCTFSDGCIIKATGGVINRTDGRGIQYRRKIFYVAALVLFLFVYLGNFSWPPLSRNDCFKFNNSFKSYLAINPLQNFFATLKLRKPDFNEQKARAAFPVMAEWMQLPDKNNFSFRRQIGPRSNSHGKPPQHCAGAMRIL